MRNVVLGLVAVFVVTVVMSPVAYAQPDDNKDRIARGQTDVDPDRVNGLFHGRRRSDLESRDGSIRAEPDLPFHPVEQAVGRGRRRNDRVGSRADREDQSSANGGRPAALRAGNRRQDRFRQIEPKESHNTIEQKKFLRSPEIQIELGRGAECLSN